ncbi:hypothetical protein Dip510_000840 [Elusimicrobium posterum]|uniref:hypothetical protein n=1 Tax=Elusimicrobium posterum TaxID=3116653 RepID=UPI003C74170B
MRWDKRKKVWRKIRNWESTAAVFEYYEKQNGAINWNDPKKPEEKLFKWYCENMQEEIFKNDEARQSEWDSVKGHCARIIAVCGTFEHAQEVVLLGAEKLQKFSVTLRALANNIYQYKADYDKANGYGG